jgi:UDP-N-acetylmuramoylalanine--D-glutamate ligase
MTRLVVIGFGVTGRAVSRWAIAAGYEVDVFDDRADAALVEAGRQAGVAVEPSPTGARLDARLRRADLVVPSPGVPAGHPVLQAALNLGRPVHSEIELAWRASLAHPTSRLLAITGTNGKTTVTTLVQAILESSGLSALAAGNIGLPLIDAVAAGHQFVVAEVSSFQLQFTEQFRPAVSCWLNLAPDHLDWHPDLAHYAAAKCRVWANQGDGDQAVFNADDPAVAAHSAHIPPRVERLAFSTVGPAAFGLAAGTLTGPGGEPVVDADELPRSLPHDLSNALAAAAVATAAGASLAACREALVRTGPLPHRIELVASAAGVDWYDDSKATTPASVLAAVAGFPSVVLIAGGRNKGLDLSVLSGAVPPVRAVVAIGEAAAEVEASLGPLVPTVTAASMDHAVAAAASLARPGDAVVLSPGCASFDWYRSYAERGADFARAVSRLTHEGGRRC